MRASVVTLLDALAARAALGEERTLLREFMISRIQRVEDVLREAVARSVNAKLRLALEDVVAKCSFELDAARGLLQVFEDAVDGQRVRLCPLDLVRQTFARPRDRDAGRPLISAVLSSHDNGGEVDINPRTMMALIGLGVELVGEREERRELPHVTVVSDARGLSVRIERRADVSGEPLVLATRGLIQPTLPCVCAAAALSGGHLDWNAEREVFSLSYPATPGARASGASRRGSA
jgi:hypothetical protein